MSIQDYLSPSQYAATFMAAAIHRLMVGLSVVWLVYLKAQGMQET